MNKLLNMTVINDLANLRNCKILNQVVQFLRNKGSNGPKCGITPLNTVLLVLF